jgi:uncharacterized membrane protein
MLKIREELPDGNEKPIFVFFEELFIYFWVCSLIGHYLEIFASHIYQMIYGGRLWTPIIQTIVPISVPYGFGAVAVIILTVPLVKKYKLHPIGAFFLNIFITGAVEYLCAAVIVLVDGHNRFWNYSHDFMNINGYVCLKSAVLFSIAATLFIYLVYPFFEKIFSRLIRRQIDVIFWVLFLTYGADLLNSTLHGNIF